MASTTDHIRKFLLDELHLGESATLTDDYPLLERGMIDSAGLVQLVVFLEDQFGIEIDEEDLVPEHFSTIVAIGTLVESRRG